MIYLNLLVKITAARQMLQENMFEQFYFLVLLHQRKTMVMY